MMLSWWIFHYDTSPELCTLACSSFNFAFCSMSCIQIYKRLFPFEFSDLTIRWMLVPCALMKVKDYIIYYLCQLIIKFPSNYSTWMVFMKMEKHNSCCLWALSLALSVSWILVEVADKILSSFEYVGSSLDWSLLWF